MSGSRRLPAPHLNLSVIEVGPADVPRLSALRAKMFATFVDTDPVVLAEADLAFFVPALAAGEAAAWLIQDQDGRAVCSCAVSLYRLPPKPFSLPGLYAHVTSLWTEPEYRRQGLASGLLDRALAFARQSGALHATLHATDKGRPLYEGLGFSLTSEMRQVLDR